MNSVLEKIYEQNERIVASNIASQNTIPNNNNPSEDNIDRIMNQTGLKVQRGGY